MFLEQVVIGDHQIQTTYQLVTDQLLIRFAPGVESDEMDEILQSEGLRRIEVDPLQGSGGDIRFANDWLVESRLLWTIFELDRTQAEYLAALQVRGAEIESVSPVYVPEDENLHSAAAVLLDELTVHVDDSAGSNARDILAQHERLTSSDELTDELAPFYAFRVNVDVGNPQESYEILDAVRGIEGVTSAEHGWLQLTGFYDSVPDDREYNDPLRWENYWGLRAINVEGGWKIRNQAGGGQVTIAIIDGGFELHDDIPYHPATPASMFDGAPDLKRHGTRVAGIAAARTANGLGTVSVGFECEIHPIRLVATTPDQVRRTIVQAVNLGASVINLSGGFPDLLTHHVDMIRGSLEYAFKHDVVVVAAAGNQNREIVDYPARDARVIGVGASDRFLYRRFNSNFAHGLSVVAPGDDCWTTDVPNTYAAFSATSCAAPHVAGLAALMRSARPDLPADSVRKLIETTCRKVHQGSSRSPYLYNVPESHGAWDRYVGYGLIDCAAALEAARDAIVPRHESSTPPVGGGWFVSTESASARQYCGYLGKSIEPHHERLYCNLNLDEWIEIPSDAILAIYPVELLRPSPALSKSLVSVRAGAHLMRRRRTSPIPSAWTG